MRLQPHPIFQSLPNVPRTMRAPLPPLPHLGLDPQPFVLVKPMSLQWIDPIREEIRRLDFTIEGEMPIQHYEKLARYLYGIGPRPVHRYMWLMLARRMCPETYDHAHVFYLDRCHLADYDQIEAAKMQIRATLGLIPCHIRFLKHVRWSYHNHIHTPDEDTLSDEYNALIHTVADLVAV